MDQVAILSHLSAVERSNTFRGVARERELLRFLIEQMLNGKSSELKAGTIAISILKRVSPDTNDLANARALAGRLRKRLPVFYQMEGASEPMTISIPLGEYVPRIEPRSMPPSSPAPFADVPAVKTSEPAAEHPRIALFIAYQRMNVATEEKRWTDVIKAFDDYIALNISETLLSAKERGEVLESMRFQRLSAMCQSARDREVLAAELETTEFARVFSGSLYVVVLGTAIALFAKTRRTVALERTLPTFIDLLPVKDDSQRMQVTRTFLGTGISLIEDEEHKIGVYVLQHLCDHVHNQGPEFEEILIKAHEMLVGSLRKIGELARSLAAYEQIAHHRGRAQQPQIDHLLAWAGVGAVRTLRALKRYKEAEDLASSLYEQYHLSPDSETANAARWAAAEIVEHFKSVNDYAAALDYSARLIDEWTAANSDHKLDVFIAWGYAERISCLMECNDFGSVLRTMEILIERFGDSDNPEIQFQVTWACTNKVRALKKLKHFGAAVAAAEDLLAILPNATSRRILREKVFGLHAKGDVLILEGKLFMNNEMADDARLKFEAACDMFSQAVEREPLQYSHYACRAYAQYLTGHHDLSEKDFKRAIAVQAPTWLKGDEWTELSMFSTHEDDNFMKSVHRWLRECGMAPTSNEQ